MLCGVHLVTASHREMRGKRVDESKVLHNWYRSMSGNDPLVEAVLARSSQMMTTLTTVQSIVPSLAPLLVAVEVNHEAMAQMLLGVKPDLALETTTPVLHLSLPGTSTGLDRAAPCCAARAGPATAAHCRGGQCAQERQWRSVYGSKITGASGKSGPGRVKVENLQQLEPHPFVHTRRSSWYDGASYSGKAWSSGGCSRTHCSRC